MVVRLLRFQRVRTIKRKLAQFLQSNSDSLQYLEKERVRVVVPAMQYDFAQNKQIPMVFE